MLGSDRRLAAEHLPERASQERFGHAREHVHDDRACLLSKARELSKPIPAGHVEVRGLIGTDLFRFRLDDRLHALRGLLPARVPGHRRRFRGVEHDGIHQVQRQAAGRKYDEVDRVAEELTESLLPVAPVFAAAATSLAGADFGDGLEQMDDVVGQAGPGARSADLVVEEIEGKSRSRGEDPKILEPTGGFAPFLPHLALVGLRREHKATESSGEEAPRDCLAGTAGFPGSGHPKDLRSLAGVADAPVVIRREGEERSI